MRVSSRWASVHVTMSPRLRKMRKMTPEKILENSRKTEKSLEKLKTLALTMYTGCPITYYSAHAHAHDVTLELDY